MAVTFEGIDSEQEMEVPVSGPDGANKLFLYTGVAMIFFQGTGSDWLRDSVSFEVGRSFMESEFLRAVATASLASIANDHKAVNAGWAVDRVTVSRSASTGKTMLTINLAVRDSDGYVHRVAYEASVLAKV